LWGTRGGGLLQQSGGWCLGWGVAHVKKDGKGISWERKTHCWKKSYRSNNQSSVASSREEGGRFTSRWEKKSESKKSGKPYQGHETSLRWSKKGGGQGGTDDEFSLPFTKNPPSSHLRKCLPFELGKSIFPTSLQEENPKRGGGGESLSK